MPPTKLWSYHELTAMTEQQIRLCYKSAQVSADDHHHRAARDMALGAYLLWYAISGPRRDPQDDTHLFQLATHGAV